LLGQENFTKYSIDDIKIAFDTKYTSPEVTAEEDSEEEQKVKDLWIPYIYWRHEDVFNFWSIN
jgi:hypothetical protein